MKSGLRYIGALSLAFSAVACGNSDASTDTGSDKTGADTAKDKRKEITREDGSDSEFRPVELENTVDKLVKAIEAEPAESMQLKVVLKTLVGYWEPVQLGAKRALGELDVVGSVDAPLESGEDIAVARQSEMLEEDRANGFQGFAVAPFNDVVQEQIDLAVDDGIPVVTLDTDLAESKRALYIGTMNADAGETAGHSLVDLLPEGEKGTVVILGHDDPGWQDGYDRTMGAKKVIEEAGFDVQVLAVHWDETGEEVDVTAMQAALTDADPPAVGMMGMFSVAYRCAIAAEANKLEAGDLKIAAFDFDPKTVEYMRDGYIQVTHAQRQYYMGYLAPYVLYGINVLGAKETKAILKPHMVDNARFNAGLDVVPAAKMDDYYSYLDSLGIGGI